jgi:small-conductance mechanosensitive channel
VTGYVQQLNVRTTILMALDGNLVQIPNASVYKSNLRNFTTNSNRREIHPPNLVRPGPPHE